MKAVIYLRQSLDPSGLGKAVDRQRHECQKRLQYEGWQFVGEYVDNDTSASSKKPRSDYQRMLTDIRAGRIDVVVVWDLDRLTRRPIEVEEWIDLSEQYRVNLVTIGENVDLSTDNGRMFLRIKAAVARGEVERKSARQRLGNDQKAREGRPAGGPRPFGYDKTGMVPKPDEAKLIRLGYRRLLAGASLRSIAREWNEAGKRSAHGNEWRPDSVRDRLKNPRYAGVREHRGEQFGPAAWKPIVSEETWRAAVAILTNPVRRTTPGNARKYMLSGLARCVCGELVATGRTQHGKRTYKCSKSNHLSRAAEPIDDLIGRLVVAKLRRPDAHELLVDESQPDLESLRDEAQVLRAREDELAMAFGDGEMNRRQFQVANRQVSDQLAAIEARMEPSLRAEVLRDMVNAKDPQSLWDGLEVNRRRAVVSTLMSLKLLSPGRGRRNFDPNTVIVDWSS